MKVWFCGLVVAFATFALIEMKPNIEHNVHTRAIDDLHVPFSASPGTDLFKPIDITLEGEYFWEMIYYIDNTNQNNPYKETRKITKSVTESYSDLENSVQETIKKTSTSLDVGGIFNIISVGVKGSMDTELTRSYQSTVEKKSETKVTEELTREFTVGANSIGEMHRLVYKGPGVTYETGTISTNGTLPLEKVVITCQVRQVPMIQDIQVVLTGQSVERPENVITDTLGGSPDVNKGFGGSYVWLVPVWTVKKEEAVTKIQVAIQSEKNSAYTDLAAGAGGAFRYLKMLKDSSSSTRIKRIGLLRSPKSKYIYGDRHEYGWDECTSDINEDRGGDWLHLCWNTVRVQ